MQIYRRMWAIVRSLSLLATIVDLITSLVNICFFLSLIFLESLGTIKIELKRALRSFTELLLKFIVSQQLGKLSITHSSMHLSFHLLTFFYLELLKTLADLLDTFVTVSSAPWTLSDNVVWLHLLGVLWCGVSSQLVS